MHPSAPIGFEQIRLDAVRRMFARTPKLAMLIFEPTFAGMAIYAAWTTKEPWCRVLALVLLVGITGVNLVGMRRVDPTRDAFRQVMMPLRWSLGISLVAITGGPLSPLLPFLLISTLSAPSLLGRHKAAAKCAISIAAVWGLTFLEGRGQPVAYIHAACMTTLLVAALFVGLWVREISDDIVRSSLQARDEALRMHGERIAELTTLSRELAHELKNPLASIKGLAGLMELEPARAVERLQVLRREVCRMQGIIDEFLDFSRPLTPLQTEPTNLRALIAEVVTLHEGLARQKQLTFDTSHVEAVEVHSDPRKVKQILINVVLNAIEASSVGGTIELTASCERGHARIAVLDEGPGLSEALLERCMEPGVTTKDKGAGLGLTIARALAEQHGGAFRLRNRDEGGAAAEFDLPLRCPQGCFDRQLA